MEKTAIFGGSFNPVHNAHIKIATVAMEKTGLDRVIFVPANIQPFKQEDTVIKSEDRYNMLCLATAHDKRFTVSDFEIKNGGISYSYITAEHFKNAYPDSKLYFILGDDSYNSVDRWMEADRLKKCVQFIVFPRIGLDKRDENTIYIDMPLYDISSTGVRYALANGEDVSDMINPAVLDYIEKHDLYKYADKGR